MVGNVPIECGTWKGEESFTICEMDDITRTGGGIAHYPSSHVRARSKETQPNLRFAIRVSGLPASSRGTSNGFSPPFEEVPPYICFCSPLQDPPPGVVGVAPGHSRDTLGNSRLLVLGLPGPYLPNQVSDQRVL